MDAMREQTPRVRVLRALKAHRDASTNGSGTVQVQNLASEMGEKISVVRDWCVSLASEGLVDLVQGPPVATDYVRLTDKGLEEIGDAV
jgi:Mn-dependent DtxR family transcriptional regulator